MDLTGIRRDIAEQDGNKYLWNKIRLVCEMALGEKSAPEELPSHEEAGHEVKKKFLSCFKGMRLLKTLVIFACTVVVIQQISACIGKLIDIPVTTYTHFDFNKTIAYPSVTFCREPAYKYEKMEDYNLYSHPRMTSAWINYNFSISLDELWEDITYNEKDMFVQYGLGGSEDNIELQSTMGFVLGRCYTMNPKILGSHPSKPAGYSVMLRHSAADIATISGVNPPGYHVFVHYTREPFTEVEVYNGGLVQTLFLNVGETIEVKLTVDEYLKISREDDPCTHDDDYSANMCTAQLVWDIVGQEAGCSGPWMNSDLPRCDNYTNIRNLITAYIDTYQKHKCDLCPRFCRSCLYNSYVTDRQTFYNWDTSAKKWCMRTADSALQTQLYIYFNSMMVSVYEERYNYDWNLFISDLGGSVGFLLGLSVIGLLQIMGKTWDQFIRPFVKTKSRSTSIADSTTTADVTTINIRYPYIIEEGNAWKKMGD